MEHEKGPYWCDCKGCQEERANQLRHLEHPFYKDAHEYREGERRGQIIKGSEKYPKPFDPDDWTPKQLLSHAMQENVDQGHYIYGLYTKIERLENENMELKKDLTLVQIERDYFQQRLAREIEEGGKGR